MANEIMQLPMGPRGQKISTFVKYAAVLVGGWIIAPFIFTAIGGLIGVGVAIVLYLLGTAMAPWVSLKIANLATKFFIQEIRANPVESRIKVYNERFEELKRSAGDLAEFQRSVEQFRSELVNVTKQYPEDAKRFQDTLKTMERLLELRYAGWKKAKEALEEYAEMTERVRAIWKMTLASDKLHKSAGRLEETAHQKIINDESIRVAEEGMANSFADLNHLLKMEEIEDASPTNVVPIVQETPLLERSPTGTFILPSLTVKRSDKIAA